MSGQRDGPRVGRTKKPAGCIDCRFVEEVAIAGAVRFCHSNCQVQSRSQFFLSQASLAPALDQQRCFYIDTGVGWLLA